VDLGRLFSNLDMDAVAGAASFVMENRDDFAKVLDLVKDLPDGVAGFLRQLPEFLEALGGGLAQAGEQAAKAANALVGDDGGGGARRALSGGAAVSTQLGDIDIPDMVPTYTKIAGFDVISGIDVTRNRLLGGPAQSLNEGAQTVTAVAGNLDTLSASLRELSDILGSVGEALDGLGERLASSGQTVRTLMAPA